MLPTHVVRMPGTSSEGSDAYPPSVTSSGASSQSKPQRKSRGITSLTVDVGEASSASKGSSNVASPPRWRTPEFLLYYLIFLLAVPLMISVPVRLSQPTNPNYARFRSHLTQGWLFGRQRDNSDFQYRSFRDYIPALTGIMGVYLACGWLAGRMGRRREFLGVFCAVFVIALHGSNCLKLGVILGVNYALAKALGGRKYVAPAVIWSFNVSALALVHWNDGFQWGAIGGDSLAWLDEWNGLLPRWQINFNITMLRLVSFALDLHWARCEPTTLVRKNTPATQDNRTRSRQSHLQSQYNLQNYLLYTLYPPLFIAGPIMTFNDFTSQSLTPPCIPTSSTIRYTFRFLTSLLTMEFILHYMYVNAIKDTHAWKGESPLELSMVGFWNLIIVWLKLLLPWRFFRLWALADGVDPPENMIRCMANNYSTLGFWRSWHRSYNLWIVRYIYIPVGGAKNTFGLPATLLVFTFVALWHDLSLKLLTWGWLVTAFIVPELLAKALLPASKYGKRNWYRHVAALGGVFNVLLMMTANLVGFAIGLDGIKYMWEQILGSVNGVKFLVGAVGTLFVGVQVMFEYREEEARRGIYRKC